MLFKLLSLGKYRELLTLFIQLACLKICMLASGQDLYSEQDDLLRDKLVASTWLPMYKRMIACYLVVTSCLTTSEVETVSESS